MTIQLDYPQLVQIMEPQLLFKTEGGPVYNQMLSSLLCTQRLATVDSA